MQRPILVLVLVLAAIGALLFGVFSLLKDPEGPAQPQPEVVKPAEQTKRQPAVLDTESRQGKTDRTASGDGGREAPEDTNNYQYDNQLAGLVVDKNGKPIADVELTLTAAWTGDLIFQNDPVDRTKDSVRRTNKDGQFSFHALEPRNKYKLILLHPEYTRKEIDTVPVLPQGKSEEPPITLTNGASIAGHVRDEANNAIPNATIHLDGIQYQASPYEAPDRITVTSNNEGYFTMRNIPAGNRVLSITAPGFGTASVTGLMFQKDELITRDVILKIAEMICGRVIGPGNVGIPNAMVLAIGFNSTAQSTRQQAITDAKGEFCIESLLPGPYNVLATSKGWRFDKAQRVNSNSQNVVIEGFKEADACGRVLDAESGAPVANFKVRLRLSYPGNPATQPVPDSDVEVDGNATGEYCIPGVQQSGDAGYVVEAMAPGYAPGFSAVFSVAPGQSVNGIDVRLGHGGVLTGRVVDADGKPVARALVITHDNEWTDDAFTQAIGIEYPTQATSAQARSNSQGFFTVKNLNPEVYQIIIEAAGFCAFEQKDINVAAGQPNNVGDIRLSRGGTISGRLIDPSGKALAGGRVQLDILEGDRPRTFRAKSAGDGTYTITNIVPGRYKLAGSAVGSDDGNPFTGLRDMQNSERQIVINDGDNQRGVDVTLSQ
ncbi:MAG: carboxypeptidase regulatory-like domain-containing protein [Planctomycetes bacterium]|nr:carboxypeptidase regulatory-like domain-containing protein [Planctomycetota bacterium]